METNTNPREQQLKAKLSLLKLGDDHQNYQQNQISEENQFWGRSLQTQTHLRQKISQRYKAKRKTSRQLRSRSTTNNQNKPKKQNTNDKQSLKDLLKKLQSRELRHSKVQSLRQSMFLEIRNSSKDRSWAVKNESDRSIIEHKNRENRSVRRVFKQLSENEQNNFISKKLQILNKNKSALDQNSQQPILDYKHNKQQQFSRGMSFTKRRQFCPESKIQKKKITWLFRKNTQNKENEGLGFMEFPLDPYKNADLIKNSVLILKKQNNKHDTLERQEINKRTFQILQEINRTRSINSVKKLTSQSLKIKKSQMCPYSRVLKDRINFIDENNGLRGNVLINKNKDNIWVKLQIRK